jgi:hypothetical protein
MLFESSVRKKAEFSACSLNPISSVELGVGVIVNVGVGVIVLVGVILGVGVGETGGP